MSGPLQETPASVATDSASGGGRVAILILTIIAGFFSVSVGGCTAIMSEGVAEMGQGLSELDDRLGGGNAAEMRREVEELRTQGAVMLLGMLLQAFLGVAGGVYAFWKYNTPSCLVISSVRLKHLTVASMVILFAATMSLQNCFGFITAGVLNAIAGALALMRSRTMALE